MTLAIETTHLTRRFPGGFGVHDLALQVPPAAIYGFLGPNGAGKTTTIRLLLDLLRPDAGTIALFGEPLTRTARAPLRHVGALVEMPSLYAHLTGRENLEVTRRLLAAAPARIDAVLARTGLSDSADRRVSAYSLGMRQRLAIALALLGEPRLLILDEPTNGLDPAGIVDMRALLRGLAGEGVTVFVSSHLLAEVDQIASHVGVLHGGRLRFQGRIEELRARARPRLHVHVDDAPRAMALLAAAGEAIESTTPPTANDPRHTANEGSFVVTLGPRPESEINRLLVEAGLAVTHLAREQSSLEALFFDLTADTEAAT